MSDVYNGGVMLSATKWRTEFRDISARFIVERITLNRVFIGNVFLLLEEYV